jgi:hypothetical protein
LSRHLEFLYPSDALTHVRTLQKHARKSPGRKLDGSDLLTQDKRQKRP